MMIAADQDYGVKREKQDGIDVVRLSDTRHKIDLTIVPALGNMAVSAKVNGHEILWVPSRSIPELVKTKGFGGIPVLAPWANRIDGMSYWVDGKKFLLNPDLGNLRLDPNHLPIHGLLSASSLWEVTDSGSESDSAYATSQVNFWKYPELMAQFPFAHTIAMTYRLRGGAIEVEAVLKNLGQTAMPVLLGFHPYFQVEDAPRDEWVAHVAASEHVVLNERLTPTGETRKMDLADPFPLKGGKLDDVFTGLVRGSNGIAEFWVKGKQQKITVEYGPKYTVAVVYAPPGRSFICFEPMSAPTNALNLAHEGKYKELQTVKPGGEWREIFRIVPSGF